MTVAVDTSDEADALANAVGGKGSDEEQQDFPEDITILQGFWMVAKLAVPIIFGMLLYLAV